MTRAELEGLLWERLKTAGEVPHTSIVGLAPLLHESINAREAKEPDGE